MKKHVNLSKQLVMASLVLTFIVNACNKETEPTLGSEPDLLAANETDFGIAAITGNLNVNWNNRAHGTTYTSTQAAEDFGNVGGWNNSRAYISNGTCRITLLPNALSGAGGVVANVDVTDGTAYELDFDVKFHSQFDFSRGGKIGFGFGVGDGNAGGDPGWDGNGGSLRLMWYTNDNGRTYFHPYVYHRDQEGQYGDNFGASYPSSGSLQKEQWYSVHMYIKSNTGSSTNGRAQIKINGTTLIDRNIRWTTNDTKRFIRNLWFHTFRGGSQSYWQSNTTGYIYYDNLRVNKLE